MSSSRRARRAPALYGTFAEQEAVDKALKHAGASSDASSDSDCSEDEGEQLVRPPAKRARQSSGGGGKRQHGKRSALEEGDDEREELEEPYVSPCSLKDVLTLEPMRELLLQTDAVAALPQVCQDVASLCVALGLRSSDPTAGVLWCGLAAREAGGAAGGAADAFRATMEAQLKKKGARAHLLAREGAVAAAAAQAAQRVQAAAALDGSTEAALSFLRQAHAAHPSRDGLIEKQYARDTLQLTSKEIQEIPVEKGYHGRKMLREFEARSMAHRKWGGEPGLRAVLARRAAAFSARQVRRKAAVEAYTSKHEERIESMVARFEAEGLESSLVHDTSDVLACVLHYDFIADHRKKEDTAVEAARRLLELREKLASESLTPNHAPETVRHLASWLASGSATALEASLAALREAEAEKAARAARLAELDELLKGGSVAGLIKDPSVTRYRSLVQCGGQPEGGAQAVVAGLRSKLEASAAQAQQKATELVEGEDVRLEREERAAHLRLECAQRELQRAQEHVQRAEAARAEAPEAKRAMQERADALRSRLLDEGMMQPNLNCVPTARDFVCAGLGGVDSVVAQLHARAAAAAAVWHSIPQHAYGYLTALMGEQQAAAGAAGGGQGAAPAAAGGAAAGAGQGVGQAAADLSDSDAEWDSDVE